MCTHACVHAEPCIHACARASACVHACLCACTHPSCDRLRPCKRISRDFCLHKSLSLLLSSYDRATPLAVLCLCGSTSNANAQGPPPLLSPLPPPPVPPPTHTYTHIYTYMHTHTQVDGQSKLMGEGQKFEPQYAAFRHFGLVVSVCVHAHA